MRKNTIGVVIFTLVIATVFAPMAGSSNISVKNISNDPIYGALNPQANYAFSKKGSNLDNWGITPSISLGSGSSATLMYFHKFDIVGSDKGYVKISSNGGSSWTTLWEFQGIIAKWELNFFDISQYTGKSVLIGFQYVTKSESTSQGWSVDKINVVVDGQNKYEEDFEDYDVNDPWEDWIITADQTPQNYPPYPPKIEGPNKGDINEAVLFNFHASDPDRDAISYYIEWGDGVLTDWTDYLPVGPGGYSEYEEEHTWSAEGTFTIRAKVKDINNAESPWTEHTIKINKGRSRQSDNLIFLKILERLFEQISKFFPILNKVF